MYPKANTMHMNMEYSCQYHGSWSHAASNAWGHSFRVHARYSGSYKLCCISWVWLKVTLKKHLPHALFPSPYEHLTHKTIESCLSWQWQMNSMLLQRLTDWDYDSLYCVSVLSLYTHRKWELRRAVRETDMGRWTGLGLIVWQLLHKRQCEVSGTTY